MDTSPPPVTPPLRIRIPVIVEEEAAAASPLFITPHPSTQGMSRAEVLDCEWKYICHLVQLFKTATSCYNQSCLALALVQYIYYHPTNMMSSAARRNALKENCLGYIKSVRTGMATSIDDIAEDLEWYSSELIYSIRMRAMKEKSSAK